MYLKVTCKFGNLDPVFVGPFCSFAARETAQQNIHGTAIRNGFALSQVSTPEKGATTISQNDFWKNHAS